MIDSILNVLGLKDNVVFIWFIERTSCILILLSVVLVAFVSGQLTPPVLWLFGINFIVLLLIRWTAKLEEWYKDGH